MSWKPCETGLKLVLFTNRKSHTSFRLVQKVVTLNYLEPLTVFQIIEKCPISLCWRILQKIPISVSERGWLPRSNQFFLVHRYVCGKIFTKIPSVVVSFYVKLRQTADRHTDKRRALHNPLSGGKYGEVIDCVPRFHRMSRSLPVRSHRGDRTLIDNYCFMPETTYCT